jgi:regulator of sigma E protease
MSFLIFAIVLSVLILVHEFGHFIVAKKKGVWVEEFGLGLPPRLYGKKFGDTLYSINALPIGGFVKLHGENVEDGKIDKKRSFLHLPLKKKIPIITAGVFMNFVLAIVCFGLFYSFAGFPRQSENIKIVDVVVESPAYSAGLMRGDLVKRVDGNEIRSTADFINSVTAAKGEEVSLGIIRDGEEMNLALTPRTDVPEGQGPIGVAISGYETYFPEIWKRPFLGIFFGFKEAVFWGWAVVVGITMLLININFRPNPAGHIRACWHLCFDKRGLLLRIAFFG